MTKPKKEFYSMISNVIHISESEIAALYPDYEYSWFEEYPDKIRGILFDLGLDTNEHWEFQDATQHRNRLNKVVTCGRVYGSERTCKEWLNSGLASQAAKDKAKNSRLLDDLYRSKAMTIDTQLALESRDRYQKIEDEMEEE